MKFYSVSKLFLSTLALVLTTLPAKADEEINCGTQDEIVTNASMDTLPRIRAYTGVLKAVVFRVEFSDVVSNVTEATITANNIIINNFYKAMSQNRFYWDFAIYPQVLKMPGAKASYDNNFNTLRTDITAAVNATPLRRGTDYAVYNITFPQLTLGWSGLSSGGTSGQNYMNGSYGTGVTSHEMGHTVGLAHAHSIEAGTTDFFGTPGTTSQHVEYGHPYDVMGRGGSAGHFNICYKYRDGWTGPNEVYEAKATGLFRIYAQDNMEHTNRLLGIRVPSTDARYGYWFEYHSNSTANRRGASVMMDGWQGTSSRADTWFMDFTPATTTENDGVMIPNMEFKDKWGEATFKVTAVNAVAGAEGWVEVQVTIPGSTPILRPLARHKLLRGDISMVPAYSLMGKVVQNLSSRQALVLRAEEGQTPRLIFQTR